MSSIGSTQAGGGLAQFLPSLSPASSSSSNASSGSTNSTASSFLQKLGQHRKHGGGGFAKLASAVTSALQSASNGSGGSVATDANQAITQALTKIFANGSITSPGPGDADAPASNSTTGNATSGGATTTAAAGLPAEFVKTLQGFGVTPQQFQSDVTAALKTAQQNGGADISSAFKSFPIGSVVDSIG